MADAKTIIQIILPDGEPRGIRIASVSNKIVKAVQFPRARLDRITGREEMEHVGIYFLFGESDEKAKPKAYIGQTEDLKGRLKNHDAKKEFWSTAVFLISQTNSFTVAHIRYLEWYCIDRATETGRYALENGNTGSKPFITEAIGPEVLDAFETCSILLSTLGFPIFEPVAGKPTTDVEKITYYCAGTDAKGTGRMVEDGFVVLKGSIARAESAKGAKKHIVEGRQKLVTDGILVPHEGSFRFTEDYLFDSPSGAANVLLGRSSNGWIEWKTIDGCTLKDVEQTATEA